MHALHVMYLTGKVCFTRLKVVRFLYTSHLFKYSLDPQIFQTAINTRGPPPRAEAGSSPLQPPAGLAQRELTVASHLSHIADVLDDVSAVLLSF